MLPLPAAPPPRALFCCKAPITPYKIGVEQGLENAGYTITSKAWLDNYDREYAQTYEEYRVISFRRIRSFVCAAH